LWSTLTVHSDDEDDEEEAPRPVPALPEFTEVTTWHKKVHSGKIAKPIVRAAELVRNSKVVWATQNQGTKGVGAQSVLYIKTGTQEIIAHNNKKNLPAAIALS
jgi:hypothetical protein